MSAAKAKPVDASGAPVEADRLYVSLMGLAVEGVRDVFPEGSRLRGDHVAVTTAPGFFAPADLPDDERSRLRAGTWRTAPPAPRIGARPKTAHVRAVDGVIALRNVEARGDMPRITGGTVSCRKGARLAKTDPLVAQQGDAFAAVMAEGATDPARCALALEHLQTTHADGSVEEIHPGQLVPLASAWRALYPAAFGPVPVEDLEET